MSAWSYVWLGLLAACVCVELAGLVDKRTDDTLPQHLWKWLTLRDNRSIGWVCFRRTTLFLAVAWPSVYSLTGGQF